MLQWSNEWLLPFNIEKCKVLHYGKVNPMNDYMMNDISVLSDSSIKDLGTTFQDTLTFDEHISKITSTSNSRLGIIRNTFHIIDKEGFLILYKGNVRPILGMVFQYGPLILENMIRRLNKSNGGLQD